MRPGNAISGGVSKFAKACPDKTFPAIVKEAYDDQNSPWFSGASDRHLSATREPASGCTYATPRAHDICCGSETAWIDITDRPASIHAFTVCNLGFEENLPETRFVLAWIGFEGVNTLLLARLFGVDTDEAALDWSGMRDQPKFRCNSRLKPTDVYFIPAGEGDWTDAGAPPEQ